MNYKYKIEDTMGCTAYNLSINGKSVDDMTEQEKDEVFDYLLLQLKSLYKDHGIDIREILRYFDPDESEQDKEPCDQCGDYVSVDTYYL